MWHWGGINKNQQPCHRKDQGEISKEVQKEEGIIERIPTKASRSHVRFVSPGMGNGEIKEKYIPQRMVRKGIMITNIINRMEDNGIKGRRKRSAFWKEEYGDWGNHHHGSRS